MMLIQSSLPSSIETAFTFTSDHVGKELLCDWTSGAETWQECPRCDKHPNVGHERVVSFTKRKNDCGSCSLNCLSSSYQRSTVATMSENSAPTFVYQRRKLQKGYASVCPAQTSTKAKPSSNCVSAISSEGPSVAAKEPFVSLVKVETEAVRASVMLPVECNRGALVSKSASMGGCSLDKELGSVEDPKADMCKIVDVCFVNDSCSSSKSNMDLCATLKTEVDDTGECSSSDAFVMDLQDDISRKDVCISILKGLGLHKEVWLVNNRASHEGLGINSNCSCWRSCKVCDQSEITLKMLICDQCEEAFHVSCCYPRLKKIPHDEWFCHSCLMKRRKILKDSTSSSEMSRCRNATSKDVLGPIAVMLFDTEPYTTNVRIGREFQAEVPDWSGPIATEVDNIGELLEINPSEGVNFQERSSGKSSRHSSICNWLQCREIIYGIGEGVNGTVCGKWRRAPLFEVQTDNWECFRSFLWDPTHADCAVPQEWDADKVLKELKYIEMLRPQLAAKKPKLGCNKSVDSNGPAEDVRTMDAL